MENNKNMNQTELIAKERPNTKEYRPVITAILNQKGVLDVDTVKGCAAGLSARENGCYGECYALKIAKRYGIDFSKAITRRATPKAFADVFAKVANHYENWYRIGTAGDPSHDWEATVRVCEMLAPTRKTPAIITKHWKTISDNQAKRLASVGAVVNTSTSGMDTDNELAHRVKQIHRLAFLGVTSVNRVVTAKYGDTEWAIECKRKQDYLLTINPIIDNPLRATKDNPRVQSGEIILTNVPEAIGGGKLVSLHRDGIFLGHCKDCVDKCGVKQNT